MKWALIFLLSAHGLLHLLGFAKACNLSTIQGFPSQTLLPSSKAASQPAGVLWLLACAAFLTTALGFLLHKQWWTLFGFAAVLLSQALIIFHWKDARWGSLANVFILLPLLASAAQQRFEQTIDKEIEALLSAPVKTKTVVTKEALSHLPSPVQTWLLNSGAVGKETVRFTRLKQTGFMRLKPEQKEWIETSAEQYFRWNEPAFVWRVKLNLMPLVPVAGRDKFGSGTGAMTIKAFSLFNVVNETGGDKLNQSALQRLLAEICWTPSAALNACIRWKAVNDSTADATITCGGVSGTVRFFFTPTGDVKACFADRYKDVGENAAPEKWRVQNNRYAVMAGIRIPVESEATWKLKAGDFTWFRLTVTAIAFNEPVRWEAGK